MSAMEAERQSFIPENQGDQLKVHVVGGPGSGKTTFARRLAQHRGLSAIELDAIAERGGQGPKFRVLYPLALRQQEINEIASSQRWVTEGSYLWWTDELFRAADLIIWLDLPRHIGIWRILKRHWREYITDIAQSASMAERLRIARRPHVRHLLEFVPYTWTYYGAPARPNDVDDPSALTRAGTARYLDHYREKVIRCSTHTEVEHWLAQLMQTGNPANGHGVKENAMDNTKTLSTVSRYAESHKADWVPVNYDEVIYDPAGYDMFAWALQKPCLTTIAEGIARKCGPLKYLDFACGTGRIIAAVERLAAESVGLDISLQMLDFARTKVSTSKLVCGDILSQPTIVDADYDFITAFRFFLNTEPDMREKVMRSLARRLAGPDSRLVFNIHGNGWSAEALKSLYQRLRGWGAASTMTYPQVRRLVEGAGLVIDTWYGFGLWPYRLYRTPFAPLLKRIDHWAARKPMLKWLSHDMLFVCRLA